MLYRRFSALCLAAGATLSPLEAQAPATPSAATPVSAITPGRFDAAVPEYFGPLFGMQAGAFQYKAGPPGWVPLVTLVGSQELWRFLVVEARAGYAHGIHHDSSDVASGGDVHQRTVPLMVADLGFQLQLPVPWVRPYVGASIGGIGAAGSSRVSQRYVRDSRSLAAGVRAAVGDRLGLRAEVRRRRDAHPGVPGSLDHLEQTLSFTYQRETARDRAPGPCIGPVSAWRRGCDLPTEPEMDGIRMSVMTGAFNYAPGTRNWWYSMTGLRAARPVGDLVLTEVRLFVVPNATHELVPGPPPESSTEFGAASAAPSTRKVTATPRTSLLGGDVGLQLELPFAGFHPYIGVSGGVYGRARPAGRMRFAGRSFSIPAGVRLRLSGRVGLQGEFRFRIDEHPGTESARNLEQTAGLTWHF